MLDRQSVIELLLERYEHPSHRGVLPCPPARSATRTNPWCGDMVAVFAEVAGGVVTRASFQGAGCTISQVAADVAMELATGRTVQAVVALDAAAILGHLGTTVLDTRLECVRVSLRALRCAVAE